MTQQIKAHLDGLITISTTTEGQRRAYARLAGAVDAFLITDSITLGEAVSYLTAGRDQQHDAR